MVGRHGKSVGRSIVWGIVIGLMVYLAGCKTTPYVETGTPLGKGELVGGGLKIEWTAPAKGTAYLIESTNNRIVETRSLDEGDTYSFSPAAESRRDEFERIFGMKPAEARFLLYFRPADTQSAEH